MRIWALATGLIIAQGTSYRTNNHFLS